MDRGSSNSINVAKRSVRREGFHTNFKCTLHSNYMSISFENDVKLRKKGAFSTSRVHSFGTRTKLKINDTLSSDILKAIDMPNFKEIRKH